MAGASRPALQATLMQRMTDALSRMLNDPTTRLAMQRVGQAEGAASGRGEEHRREGASSEAEDARDIRDSLNLSEAEARGEGDSQQNRQTRAASAIQERWR